MGLLDSLFSGNTYGGQGGGLLDFLNQSVMQQNQYRPGPGFAQPPQAAPMPVGNYQMPRIGDPSQFTPDQNSLPQAASPVQGQLAPQAPEAPQQLPPALGGGAGSFGRLFNPDGLIARLTGNDSRSIQQQNMRAEFEATRQALMGNGVDAQQASRVAMLAVMNKDAGKIVLPELLTSKQHFEKLTDAFGNQVPAFVNERDQTINGKPISEYNGGSGNGPSLFAKGVTQINSDLQGKDYLAQFSPEVQAAALDYHAGIATPTGNARKGFTDIVKRVAEKYGRDIGDPVDEARFAEKRKLRTDMGSSSNSSMGGILDNGESSFKHLAELGNSFSELGNTSHNFPGGGYIAQAQNAIGNNFGGSKTFGKLKAAEDNLMKYGQESTKFYAATGGGEAERLAAGKLVPPSSSSSEEQAAYLEKEKSLMIDRLQQKFDHIRQTLGDQEGNKEIAKHMPTIQQSIAQIDANIAKLRGGDTAPAPPTQGVDRSAIEAEMRKRGLMK